jgi:hypothetical protein
MANFGIPTWRTLRQLGANSAIRSASIWALVVPITARLLGEVEDVVSLQLMGHEFLVRLSLPFSWKVLFIAAISFFFANITYALFCPGLIKETAAYRDFAEQQRSATELKEILESLREKRQVEADIANQWINWTNQRQVHAVNANHNLLLETETRSFIEFYAVVVDALGKTNRGARFIATSFYAAGLASFAVVVCQNILFVARHW